jgi:hypothetical protein
MPSTRQESPSTSSPEPPLPLASKPLGSMLSSLVSIAHTKICLKLLYLLSYENGETTSPPPETPSPS